jgi:ABC-type dipeptide/oligopeptide/nickel transport system ATPase component
MNNFQEVMNIYEQLSSTQISAKLENERAKARIIHLEKEIESHEKARWVLTEILKNTQEETKKRIESLVTLAIRSVFEDRDFSFRLNFERKNNKMTVSPKIIENSEEYDPDEVGGSMIDIVSIALRVILWSMKYPKTRNVLILDEPFRFTGKLITKAGHMLKYLSDELKLQIILVSHDDELINICDRVLQSENGKR